MENLQKITTTLTWGEISDILNYNLNSITVSSGNFGGVGSVGKGLFSDFTELTRVHPNPQEGWFAFFYDDEEGKIFLAYTATDGSGWDTSDTPIDTLISLKPYVSMETTSLSFTGDIPALNSASGGTVEEVTLTFSDGVLQNSDGDITLKLFNTYQGTSTTLTWEDGLLLGHGSYTVQICTLGSDRRSRGIANPSYLTFLGGKLLELQES